jgi:uncharacterized protein YceK
MKNRFLVGVLLATSLIVVSLSGCASASTGNSDTPSYFTSSSQLSSWLQDNKDLQTTEFSSLTEDYIQARELQRRALDDGYIMNAYIEYEGVENYWVVCEAYLATGDVFYWSIVDFSEIHWYGNWD